MHVSEINYMQRVVRKMVINTLIKIQNTQKLNVVFSHLALNLDD